MYKQNLDYRRGVGVMRRADGADVETDSTPEVSTTVNETENAINVAELIGTLVGGNPRRRAGLMINRTFFPFSDFLLFGVLICAVIGVCKLSR